MAVKILKQSFVELNARGRAETILDDGTFRELLSPFDGIESPHLEKQGIVPQCDDGVIVGRGTIAGEPAVVVSIEGNFQGGGIGEVSGAKIAAAFELALRDNKQGIRVRPVLLFDTGGVRLQEANYGLLSISEIGSAIVALRQYVPVVGVIPGKIGSFGGMSITAGLCHTLIMTREARIGLNGPEVIEQEAGIEEIDSADRQLIWGMIGGEQRVESGLADHLVEDDISTIKEHVHLAFSKEEKEMPRSAKIELFERFLNSFDPQQSVGPADVRKRWNEKSFESRAVKEKGNLTTSRGHIWFKALTDATDTSSQAEVPSVLCKDHELNGKMVRFISVVPNENGRFPRARKGEVGIEEGWTIARYIHEAIEEDTGGEPRAIVAVIDVPSQAYGYKEELLGLHQSCAAAVNAYATARNLGHPVVSFIVGNAISGAFLSHGMQANRLVTLNDEGVNVHVMSKQSAARITRRSISELEEATKKVPSMAYDIRSFSTLGALHDLIDGVNADHPGEEDIALVKDRLEQAIIDARLGPNDLSNRLTSSEAISGGRKASIEVREKMKEQW
ncbi:biotin-independent malonate decarboxylase subunit beta [Pseudalkalibacillus hwajinpoensis]|uniref:biotin-independent malonate decarboxylase subunit beta n=1 Tax=Guptibacillus hwajinpoensis TaxID=208199 RepID=UPI00325B7276